jgi:hypothetical protein
MLSICGLWPTVLPAATIYIDSYKFAHATPSPTQADTTAPTLLSATIETDGLAFTLVFSEAVTADDWSKTSFAMLHYSTAYESGDAVGTVTYDIGTGQ